MIRIWVVLGPRLRLLRLLVVVVWAIHSCCCDFGLRCRSVGRGFVSLVLGCSTQGRLLEIGRTGRYTGTLEVENSLRVRARRREHGTAAPRSKAGS